jgi:hypothetical protein
LTSLLNLPLPKQIFCNGHRLKASRQNLFSNSFYVITGEVPVHMQMEIDGSQNDDTLKIAPLFWKVKKILTESKHTDLHKSIFAHELSKNKFCSHLTGKQSACYTSNFFFQLTAHT